MSVDIETIVLEKICNVKHFSLQLDEYIDISKNVQLLANFRFFWWKYYQEKFLFCKTLVKTTGKEIFCVTTEYLENGNWENFISIFIEGGRSYVGQNKGFVSRVKERNQNVIFTHCFCTTRHLFLNLYQQSSSCLKRCGEYGKLCKDETCRKSLVCSIV